MVVGDLGARRRQHADERRLAHVGEADEPDVGNDLKLQLDVQVLARQAGFGELGDLARRRGKMGVAPAAAAAAGDDDRLGPRKVGDDQAALGFFKDGAARHADDEVVGVGAALALGAAVLAVGGGVFALVAEIHQRRKVVIGHKKDVAAAAAVAAVRPAGRDVFFAVEGHGAVAAFAGVQPDRRGINKIACCHKVPRAVHSTGCDKKSGRPPGPARLVVYCLTVQRLRSRPMRSK